jgi:ketosteroid isomerase-like protein
LRKVPPRRPQGGQKRWQASVKGLGMTTLFGCRTVRRFGLALTFAAPAFFVPPAQAAPPDDVRAAFERFIAAQNAHDAKAVEALLLGSPEFLWITRGAPVWGTDAALRRFAALYDGTWKLEPETAALKIMMIGDTAAQLYVPITFTIGPAGQPPQQTRFLMNQVLVKTA